MKIPFRDLPPRRRRWLAAGAVVALLFALDGARAPEDQLAAGALLGVLHVYQATLSPRMPWLGVSCRFEPTCSRYAEAAIRQDGAWVGTLRAAWRIARCGPWTPSGTVDPP